MSTSLPPLAGHHDVRQLLATARSSGTLPQSILITGPRGIGKERLGLWLAQLLVCDDPGAEPCGQCRPCQLVLRLGHTDVHWFFPLPRPDASSPEKLREKLEEVRGGELQRWRENPFHQPEWEKAAAHYLASVRTMQQLASMRPVSGSRKVFVIGDAELMVPQEASQEAANAFLKLLEEPPTETTIILTSSAPGAMLPTIISRVLSLRTGSVPEAEIVALLQDVPAAEKADADRIARLARGSVRRAIQLASAGGRDGTDSERKAGRDLLVAALSEGPVARLAIAHEHRPAGARAELVGELESLGEWLRDLLAVVSGADNHVTDPAALPILRRMVEKRDVDAHGVMTALARVDGARELALGNVNPQLIVAVLLAEIQADLMPASLTSKVRAAR